MRKAHPLTRGKKPQQAYAGTAGRVVHAGTKLFDDACDFVARNDGWPHKRKITIANHQVTVANAAGVNLYKYFTKTGHRHGAFFNLKPGLRFHQNSGSHKSRRPPSVDASLSWMTRNGLRNFLRSIKPKADATILGE
jgi:hypothetical protein